MLGVQKLTRSSFNGVSERDFFCLEASKNPIPKRRKLLTKRPFLISKKGPVKKKRTLNWTGSVFPLLIMGSLWVWHSLRHNSPTPSVCQEPRKGFFWQKCTPLLAVALWVPNVLLGPISLGTFSFPLPWDWTLQKPSLLKPPFLGSCVPDVLVLCPLWRFEKSEISVHHPESEIRKLCFSGFVLGFKINVCPDA